MSDHTPHPYRDDCPGCQISLIDPVTRKPLAADDPFMVAALKAWWTMPREVRVRAHAVWIFNSRKPSDIDAVERVMKTACEYLEQGTLS